MTEEATVDAYGEAEQATGWFTVLGERVGLPFETTVFGTRVTVVRLDLRDDNHIVAICTRGRERQAIAIEDLRLPPPWPVGGEWLEAYPRWLKVS